MGAQKITAYRCDRCGRIYGDEYSASMCCKQYRCEDCGKELQAYVTVCDSCTEKRMYNNARKLTIAEYEKEFPNHMVYYDGEVYSSVDECISSLSDLIGETNDFEELHYVWGTTEYEVGLNVDTLISDMEESSDLEDFHVSEKGYTKLKEFLNKWNGEYGATAYYKNHDVVIEIPDEYKESSRQMK